MLMSDFVHFQHILWLIILEGGIYGICSLCVAGVKRIQSPREPNPGQIRYASDFDPALADSIQGINGAIEFPLSTSQSDH